MDWRVTLSEVSLGEAEIDAVTSVLRSGWLSVGPVTAQFEAECAAALGVASAVAVSSGTAALHLAAMALGLGPGDEVILPSMSFVASAATVALCGARPVFAEVKGEHDLTLDPADVARRVTPRTRAIVAMHYGGYGADMPALLGVARRHDLALIEDAAHAPLVATSTGMLGTLGDIGCFSFFATKNLTTGEGGLVVARDPSLLARVRARRAHCMSTSSWDKQQGRPSAYDVDGLGLNYRPTEMTSAVGRVQLARMDVDRRVRRELVAEYHRCLGDISGLILPFAERREDSAYHLLPVLLPAGVCRAEVQASMQQAGIQTSVHYPAMHLFSWYRQQYGYQSGSLPITEDVAIRELSLPLHVQLTFEQVELVADSLRRSIGALRPREAYVVHG